MLINNLWKCSHSNELSSKLVHGSAFLKCRGRATVAENYSIFIGIVTTWELRPNEPPRPIDLIDLPCSYSTTTECIAKCCLIHQKPLLLLVRVAVDSLPVGLAGFSWTRPIKSAAIITFPLRFKGIGKDFVMQLSRTQLLTIIGSDSAQSESSSRRDLWPITLCCAALPNKWDGSFISRENSPIRDLTYWLGLDRGEEEEEDTFQCFCLYFSQQCHNLRYRDVLNWCNVNVCVPRFFHFSTHSHFVLFSYRLDCNEVER